MEFVDKEVYYYLYCPTCSHKDLPEDEDPCHECLNESVRENSHKPLNYIRKKERRNDEEA